MKIKSRFFAVTILIVTVVCTSTVATSWAGGLQERLKQLRESVGSMENPPHEAQFTIFINEVMPRLIAISAAYRIEERLQPGEAVEDVMAFAYEIAAKRLNVPLGYWSKEMETEVPVVADVWCLMLRVIRLPKREDYKETIKMVRPTLVNGTYNRLVVRLSLKNPLFEIPTEDLISKPLPSVDAFINLDAVKMLRQREEE